VLARFRQHFTAFRINRVFRSRFHHNFPLSLWYPNPHYRQSTASISASRMGTFEGPQGKLSCTACPIQLNRRQRETGNLLHKRLACVVECSNRQR
jgi:hypothetical protein